MSRPFAEDHDDGFDGIGREWNDPSLPWRRGNGQDERTQPPKFHRIINPAEWEGLPVPPREWIVPGYVPHKTVTLLSGDGSVGKSLLAWPPAAGRALAREWIGLMPEPGRTPFTMAIAHREGDGLIALDCIRETRAPFAPEAVVDDFCKTLASYRVGRVHGDRYAGLWPAEQFKKRNVDYVPSERVKSDIYRDALPLLNSRRCQLLDIPRLISQLHGLERRTARGGKDSIDHAPGAHDDVANAVAGAIVLASRHEVPLNFHIPFAGPSRSAVMGAYETAIMGAVNPMATAEDAAYAASRGQH